MVTALCGTEHTFAILVKVPYNATVLPTDNRSLVLWQCFDELIDFV